MAYLASWIVLGIGMGTGLYDAAFGTLGRIYGASARAAITALTLIAGFSSTICWPLSAILLEHVGWRAVCLIYALAHIVLSLPMHLAFVPRDQSVTIQLPIVEPSNSVQQGTNNYLLPVLVLTLTLIAIVSAIMSVYLVIFLKARGAAMVIAVGLAALLGPSQVFARLIEIFLGRHYHPTWTLIFATGLITAGLSILLFAAPMLSLAVILYGAGVGIAWVARGTVPLALFGPHDYAVLMGRLGLPSLIAQAISPSLGAFLIDLYGVKITLTVLLTTALLALAAALWLGKTTVLTRE
jgi:MFS family permease